jgi:hypothetical protein
MIKMSDREKRHIEEVINQACAQIENWIEIRVALAREEGDLTRIL